VVPPTQARAAQRLCPGAPNGCIRWAVFNPTTLITPRRAGTRGARVLARKPPSRESKARIGVSKTRATAATVPLTAIWSPAAETASTRSRPERSQSVTALTRREATPNRAGEPRGRQVGAELTARRVVRGRQQGALAARVGSGRA